MVEGLRLDSPRPPCSIFGGQIRSPGGIGVVRFALDNSRLENLLKRISEAVSSRRQPLSALEGYRTIFAFSSSPLVMERKLDGRRCVVRLIGELDRRAAPAVRAFLDEQCILSEEIVLDLAQLTHVDASGIGAILDAYEKCTEMGGVLSTTAASPEVQRVLQRVLQITGLQRIGPFERERPDGTAPKGPPYPTTPPPAALRHRVPPRSSPVS
jgi:anti-anti-sigma factor